MKTKIAILSAAIMISAAGAMAQSTSATAPLGPTTFGIRVGVNWQNINGKDQNGNSLSGNKLATKFNLGMNAEIPVATDFYFQPGLLFTTKGTKLESGNTTDKVNLSYLEVPLNFLYKPMLGAGKLILGVGPYVAFGLGGKEKWSGSFSGERTVKFKNNVTSAEYSSTTNAYYKPLDAGANFLFGYEWASRFSAQFNAQLGLTKINPKIDGSTDKGSLKNTGFGISLGYRF